jgi:hypothetical protein
MLEFSTIFIKVSFYINKNFLVNKKLVGQIEKMLDNLDV